MKSRKEIRPSRVARRSSLEKTGAKRSTLGSGKESVTSRSKRTPSGVVTPLGSAREIIPPAESKRKVVKAWTPKLIQKGFVGISRTFLRHYARLTPHITHGEAIFIIHLMDYKWGSEAPFPAYKTLAKSMGVSVKQARRLAQSLEQKKYLRREIREATTNKFYFDGLFTELEKYVG